MNTNIEIDLEYCSNSEIKKVRDIFQETIKNQVDKVINHIAKEIVVLPHKNTFSVSIPPMYGDELIVVDFPSIEYNQDKLVNTLYLYHGALDEGRTTEDKKYALIENAKELKELADKLIQIADSLDV